MDDERWSFDRFADYRSGGGNDDDGNNGDDGIDSVA
jgi:hypothetical protein